MARYLLLGALPGLMFCIIPANETYGRFSWQLASIWLAGIVFCSWLRSWWLRIFFILALVQVIYHGPVITAYLDLLMIVIFMAAIQGFSDINADRIMDSMIAAAMLLCAWMFLQRIGIAADGHLGVSAAGPFNSNAGACFLAMCLPAFFRRRRWYFLPVIVWGLLDCHSTTGIAAAIAVMATYQTGATCTGKKWWAVILLVVMISGYFFWKIDPISNLYNADRFVAWKRTVMAYPSAPFGRGLGSFGNIFPILTAGDQRLHHVSGQEINGEVWRHAHNEYLQLGFEMGLQAMALVLAYLLWTAVCSWRETARMNHADILALSGIAAAAVGAAGFYTFHIAPTALLGCAWLGMWQGRRLIARKQGDLNEKST